MILLSQPTSVLAFSDRSQHLRLACIKECCVSFVITLPRAHLPADHSVLNPQMLSGQPFASLFIGHMAQLEIAGPFAAVGAYQNIVAERDDFASA